MEHTQTKAGAMTQGVLIFVYLAVLTGLEFFIAITMKSAPLLVVIALVKAALVLYYYMHAYRLNAETGADDRHGYLYKQGTSRLGLWFFLLSDSFVFGGLMIVQRIVRAGRGRASCRCGPASTSARTTRR